MYAPIEICITTNDSLFHITDNIHVSSRQETIEVNAMALTSYMHSLYVYTEYKVETLGDSTRSLYMAEKLSFAGIVSLCYISDKVGLQNSLHLLGVRS